MTASADIRLDLATQDKKRRTRLARMVAALSSLVGALWCFIFLIYGDSTAMAAAAIASWPSWMAMLMFALRYDHGARVFWMLAFPPVLLATTLYYSAAVDLELIFLGIVGLPFLFFSSSTENRQQWLALGYLGLITAIALSYDRFGNLAWVPAMPPPSPLRGDTVDWGIRMTVAAALMVELYYFAYLNRSSALEAQKALADADAAARSRGAFLANMSHEIRTPMNGMIGMIEVMEATDTDKQHARSIGMIRNSAFSLLRILNDILDASQIDSGKLKVERTKVELRPLIEGATQTMQSMADNHDVRLRVLVHPTMPEWIWSDSGRLRQVLLNLLSNAVKYSAKRLTGRQGHVTMLVQRGEGDSFTIEILDNGTGISDDVRATLFQPFSDGDLTSRRVVGGTGLGLSITRSLIALMGGHIRFERPPNAEGTRVRVDLPLETADGPKRTPDLSGLQVVCFDLLDQQARDGLTTMVESAGAKMHMVKDLSDLGMLLPLSGADPIFLLPNPDETVADPLAKDLKTLLPTARIIRFSAARDVRYGLLDDHTYRIQIFPMMGSELMRAIAALGGALPTSEATPHPGYALSRRQADINAPSKSADAEATQTEAHNTQPKSNDKILLVEDNQINRMVLCKQLELMGYDHDMAEHGEEGFKAWQTGAFSLILSDCQMPIMDGFEMTQRIREVEEAENKPRTPIIAITANALEGEGERCQAHGMDDYLAKPVEMEKFKNMLRYHLGHDRAETKTASTS